MPTGKTAGKTHRVSAGPLSPPKNWSDTTSSVPGQAQIHPANEELLSRVVLVTQLCPGVTSETLEEALAQFGMVQRVLLHKDPLAPASNLLSSFGCTALVEMASAEAAQKAHPATLAMLNPDDWPEIVPAPERRRMRLVDVSADAAGTGDAARAEAEEAVRRKFPPGGRDRQRRLAEQHVQEMDLIGQKKLVEHRRLDRKLKGVLETELKKHDTADGSTGLVGDLSEYYRNG